MSNVEQFPGPQLTIVVTDDEGKLAEFEALSDDPSYDGPMVITREQYEDLLRRATSNGQSLQTYLRKYLALP